MDPQNQDSSSAHLQELAHQVAQQQALLEQLLVSQGTTGTPTSGATPAADLHDLPTRPQYDWQPSGQLCDLVPTLEHSPFGMSLSDEDRKTLLDRYPPIAGLVYSPPSMLPEAERHFKPGHRREDALLRALQYATSAILQPLDVLAHSLLPVLSPEHLGHIFAILNDVCTLVLNVGGVANKARNNLALRALNPSFSIPSSNTIFTMAPDQFKETVSTHMAMQKALREARPASARPAGSSQFFRAVPPLGGGGQPAFNFRRNPNNQQRGWRPHPQATSHGRPPNSHNPFRNQIPQDGDSRQ